MSDDYMPTMTEEWLEAGAEAEWEEGERNEHSRETD